MTISFKVGTAKSTITPAAEMGPVYRAGYKMGEAERLANVVDNLFLRCLTIEKGATRVIFLSLDLIGLFRDFTDALAERLAAHGVPRESLLVATTHTHSGPDTMGLWGPSLGQSGYNERYGEFLLKESERAIVHALHSAVSAEPFFAYEERNLGVANYREPYDMSLGLWSLSFRSADETIGTLVSYTAQPELTPRHDDSISGDYPGETCRVLEERLGTPVLFLLGACGGMEPEGCEKGYAEAHTYGKKLAEALANLHLKARPVEGETLSISATEVKLPVENPGFAMMMEAGVIRRSHEPPNVRTTISKVQIGEITLFALPGETFPGIIKGIGPQGRTLFINQVNDSLGYLIPPEQFRSEPTEWAEGHHFTGHELESLGQEAGAIIRQELIRLAKL
ncbi:MAG: neutral/alkaline non-lysosomal ceramidase N-terminal domain-containing protein [Candidatus Abyssubacteria bacterium]